MRALVTGGSGFIGAHVAAELARRGEKVRIFDLHLPPHLGADIGPGQVEFVQGSVTDADKVATAMEGVEAVFHLAANAHLWAKDKRVFEHVNVGGTRAVLDAAARKGVRHVVHTSSLTVLVGRRTGLRQETVDESARPALADMLGPYCRSKYRAESAAMAAARQGMPVTIVLPTLPIGPGDTALTPPSKMILDLVNGATPAYLDCLLNLIDVRDVAAGLIAARDRGRTGDRYILGHENLGMADLLVRLERLTGAAMPRRRVPYGVALGAAVVSETIAALTGRPPTAPLTGVRLARRRVAFAAAKARRELGLTPRPVDVALKDQIAWFAETGRLTRPLPALGLNTGSDRFQAGA